MTSKSQEETEVSWHLEKSGLGSVAVKLANGGVPQVRAVLWR